MKTLGLRHVALNVTNAQESKKFYERVFGLRVEWEPDPKSVYMTSGQDNLALHEAPGFSLQGQQGLGHFGFIMPSPQDVDQAYQAMLDCQVEIAKTPKRHRDGAYSFYCKDPDGYIIQILYHPPLSGITSDSASPSEKKVERTRDL